MPNPARHIQKGLPYLTNHSWLVSARVTSTPSSPKTPPRPLGTLQDLPKSPQDLLKSSIRPPWEPLSDFPSTPQNSRKEFSKPWLAHTKGAATPYRSFLCYSVHARTRVLCRAPSWQHPYLIFNFKATGTYRRDCHTLQIIPLL